MNKRQYKKKYKKKFKKVFKMFLGYTIGFDPYWNDKTTDSQGAYHVVFKDGVPYKNNQVNS
jgi:hypothetical protein